MQLILEIFRFTVISMFLYRKRSASSHTLQLLESYRPRGSRTPRNRVLASLGDADIPRAYWRIVAEQVEMRLKGERPLLPPELSVQLESWVDLIVRRVESERKWSTPSVQGSPAARQAGPSETSRGEVLDGVLIDELQHTHATTLGAALLGKHAWDRLQMSALLRGLGFTPAQCDAAAVSVINRLVGPVSEHALNEWLPFSCLPDLMGSQVLEGGKDRFYRVSDKLLSHRHRIEQHLREHTASRFRLTRTILLYDLTNTHFEGVCARNEKARRGKNKQKRDDCPQVVVGMVFDEHGFELAHETFPGNTNDSRTLVMILRRLEQLTRDDAFLDSAVTPLVIVDAGIATRRNLEAIRQNGFSYLVNDRRGRRGRWREAFAEEGFTTIEDRPANLTVQVRAFDERSDLTGQPIERIILCRSRKRRLKEFAIRSRAESRYLAELEKLAERIEAGRLRVIAKIERAIGRLRARHTRAARFYDVHVQPATDGGTPELSWERNDEQYAHNEDLLGCYVLRTDRRDLSEVELWHLYMTLCRAEEGFRVLKSELGLRPNFHQIEPRVDGHIFITVLAYQMLRYLLFVLEQGGDTRCWQTLKRVLSTHSYTTILVSTESGEVHRLRKPGRPEPCQWAIYHQFGIRTMSNLPKSRERLNTETCSFL